jgi:serine/threonine-protein kinase
VLEIVRQAALALSEAHRAGMVHRDVKPGNLLVRKSDGAVKITDFGIARAADAVPLTQNGMVVGTAQYFSPEQAEGRVVGPPSDVYSLGVVAYECLAGRLPFMADSPVTVAMMQIRDVPPPLPPDVPAPVRALVLRTLAKDPRQRFANGGELADAVRAVQEGRPLPPPFPTPPAPVPFSPPVPAPPAPVPPPPFPAGQGAFTAQSGAAGLGGPGTPPTPPPVRVNPDGVGGTNPAQPYPPWTAAPSSTGWTPARPGDQPRRRGGRRPVWIALILLLALILAGVATVLMSERSADRSAGPPAAVSPYGRHWNTEVSMGSMTTRVR